MGPFIESQVSEDYVIVGTVKSYDSKKTSMNIRVDDVIKGDIKEINIRVWGDNGYLCRPYVTEFIINKQYVFSIYTPKETFDNAGKEKYAISICGTNWLEKEGSTVRGNIFNEKENHSLELSKLKELINGI